MVDRRQFLAHARNRYILAVKYSCQAKLKLLPTIVVSLVACRGAEAQKMDSMGCERSHDKDAAPAVQRFQCLVSLMLSSQTKDEVNFAAMMRLRDHGLTVQNILKTDPMLNCPVRTTYYNLSTA